MDDKPYMVFDVENPSLDLLPKLQELRKDRFNDEKAVRIAEQLKYTGQFKQLLAKQMETPEEDFVRFFAQRVWSGKINQSVKEKLTPLLKEAFKQFVEDRISARLKKAAEDEEKDNTNTEKATADVPEEELIDDGVETTPDELMGYQIIKAIAAAYIDPDRIVIRDNKSYCAILLDDSNRKTIVRFYFKKDSLKLDFQGIKKNEPVQIIEKVADLYKYSSTVHEIITNYLDGSKKNE